MLFTGLGYKLTLKIVLFSFNPDSVGNTGNATNALPAAITAYKPNAVPLLLADGFTNPDAKTLMAAPCKFNALYGAPNLAIGVAPAESVNNNS